MQQKFKKIEDKFNNLKEKFEAINENATKEQLEELKKEIKEYITTGFNTIQINMEKVLDLNNNNNNSKDANNSKNEEEDDESGDTVEIDIKELTRQDTFEIEEDVGLKRKASNGYNKNRKTSKNLQKELERNAKKKGKKY